VVKTLILASSSPRRIAILREKGIEPVIIPPVVDETLPDAIDPETAVLYLALKKGLAVEKKCPPGVIIAADTIVYKDKIIGKPSDEQDAFEILMSLDGVAHDVITGVALIETGTVNRKVFYVKTKVFFKKNGEKAIKEYLASGEAEDKAGGYAIQGDGGQLVDHIEGDYDNVVGFPWTRIKEELLKIGLDFRD
jgi:septum formation protein